MGSISGFKLLTMICDAVQFFFIVVVSSVKEIVLLVEMLSEYSN